jgi:hypothetical protein
MRHSHGSFGGSAGGHSESDCGGGYTFDELMHAVSPDQGRLKSVEPGDSHLELPFAQMHAAMLVKCQPRSGCEV